MSVLLLVLETLLAPFAAAGMALSFLFSRRRGLLAGLSSELPERLGGLSIEARKRLGGRRVWWLHAASAGEVGGLAPLIEALTARPGAPALLVTTTTAAGREAARRDPRVAWAQLAPLDAWPCVARLLRAARPERLVLSETELWPTTILLAARAGLRPVLVNARMTERSLGRYRLIAPLLAPALRALAAIGAQSEAESVRFASLGAAPERIAATGNTKYDRVSPSSDAGPARARLAALGWGSSPLFVAGSTHPVEEEAAIAAFLISRRGVPELRLVLAPRHVERAAGALAALEAAGLKAARWSAAPRPGADALLVDAMGVLPAFYPLARVAYVGGTWIPVGGHNLLEPALAGAPVLFGPHTGHIEHPASLLENGGGGYRVHDAEEFAARLTELCVDPARARGVGAKARELASRLQGATARTLALLEAPRD